MLGNVQALAVVEDGSVYVAEQNPARIALYDKNGSFVRVVMKAGDGPGETRRPEITMQVDTLVVYDPRQGRLSRIAPNGRLLSERRVDASDRHISASDNGYIMLPSVAAGWAGIAVRVAPDGRLDTVRWQHPMTEDRTILWQGPNWVLKGRTPFSPHAVVAFDPAGRVVIGGSKRSRWVVMSGRDTVETVILPDHAITIAKQVRDSVWAAWYAQLPPKHLPHLEEVVREDRIPTTLPPWVTFDIDRRGEWWIGRPGGDGELASWDVVTNGRIVGHVAVPATIVKASGIEPAMSFGKDLIALLHDDANGIPWIGVYRMGRGAR